ncbi:hypothetical protein FOMPIDRAFT_91837 [Fomitopsis schrenkii]|uniref:Uncharacterized protein n=1 Tax=Fomitopsis schrenkii TaxID=2126942 RepID=S8EB93_FOMSC|nr:hypothetical protein FOMPIDRAFT_91837 [Fomitopsis schrenkii]
MESPPPQTQNHVPLDNGPLPNPSSDPSTSKATDSTPVDWRIADPEPGTSPGIHLIYPFSLLAVPISQALLDVISDEMVFLLVRRQEASVVCRRGELRGIESLLKETLLKDSETSHNIDALKSARKTHEHIVRKHEKELERLMDYAVNVRHIDYGARLKEEREFERLQRRREEKAMARELDISSDEDDWISDEDKMDTSDSDGTASSEEAD